MIALRLAHDGPIHPRSDAVPAGSALAAGIELIESVPRNASLDE